MAREMAAAPARTRASGHAWAAIRALVSRLDVLPKTQPLGKVEYRPLLVAYVAGAAAIAAGAAAITVRTPPDGVALAIGAAIVFLMALYAVRALPGVQTHWTPSVFRWTIRKRIAGSDPFARKDMFLAHASGWCVKRHLVYNNIVGVDDSDPLISAL